MATRGAYTIGMEKRVSNSMPLVEEEVVEEWE